MKPQLYTKKIIMAWLFFAFGSAMGLAQTSSLQIIVQNSQYARADSIIPGVGTHTYAQGETVTLTAAALDGYTFYWSCPEAPSLDGRTDAVVTLTMDKDYVVTIVFSPGRYSFTLQQAAGGVATIVNPPANLGSIAVGTMVTVSASAATNYTFERWQPLSPADESIYPSQTSNPASVYMRHNVTLAPVFAQTTYLMSIDVDPAGIGGTVSGGGYYGSGATVPIVANANNSFSFDNWTVVSGDVTIANPNGRNTTAILGNSPGPWRIRANFSVNNPSKATLLVTTATGSQIPLTPPGSPAVVVTSASSALIEVNRNTVITLLAQSLNAAQYQFDGWTGPVNDANVPITSVIVRNATAVHANFVPRSYNFTVKTAVGTNTPDIGASKLEAVSDGLTATTASSGTSTQVIPYGNMIKLIATPASGYAFERWESLGLSPADQALLNAQGVISAPADASITMPAAPATVTAVFLKIPENRTLTLAAGTGGGATAAGTYTNPLTGLVSSPTIIAPGSASYQHGTVVTLTATPATDYTFNQWTGATVNSPSNATTTISMDAAKSVTATFTRTHSTLTVQVGPETGAGSVLDNTTNAPPATRFAVSDTVYLRPKAGGGWMFDHWEVDGVAAGYVVPLAVAMTTNRTVKAVFARPNRLTVNVNPSSAGTASGSGEYLSGAQVAIDVAPNPGYIFSNWTASAGTVASPTNRATTITLAGDAVATANLVQGRQVSITARSDTANTFSPNATDGAAIKATGAFHAGATQLTSINHPNGGGNSSAYVLQGANITLVTPPATASTDSPKWRFARWENQAYPGTALGSSVGITTDTTLCAVYSDSRRLTVKVTLDGAATDAIGVTVDGVSKYNGDTLDATYNTALALNAVAPAGYVFSTWSSVDGGSAVTTTATVTLDSDRTITANFKTKRSLTVGIVTDPSGQESAIPLDSITVYNGTTYSALTFSANPTTFAVGHGDSITLAAEATVTSGGVTYTHAGWDTNNDGVADSTASSHTVSMSADATIKAVYKRGYTLIVDVVEPGYGTTTPSGTTVYLSGTTVALGGSANLGYKFEKWTTTTGAVFASGATMLSNSVTMNADHRVTANFKRETNGLTIYIKVNGSPPSPMPSSLTVTVVGGESGLVVLSNGQSEVFNYGTNATLTAATPSGFSFSNWECTPGTLSSGTSNPVTLEMMGSQQVTACYTSEHTVQVASQTLPGGTGGAPTVNGGASVVRPYGSTVSLEANPAAGYRFVRWDIDLTGDGVSDTHSTNASYSFTLTGSTIAFAPNVITATAVYAQEYTLTIAINDASAGTTTPSVGTISTRYYDEVVSLKAEADTGWQFTNWTATGGSTISNASSSTDASVTVKGDTTAMANFSKQGNTLTAEILLDGVTPSPVNPALTITADGTTLVDGGTKGYLYGDTANVTAATGLSAYIFTGWSSAASGVLVSTTVGMNGSKTVTANYSTIRKLTLSTETRPGTETNGGTVTASGHYDISGGDYLYKHGQTATLTATANPGFVFIGWSIDGNATLTTASTLAMSADHTAKAVFAKTYTLTLAADPEAGGSAATNPVTGITSTRYYGEVVKLAATAKLGYSFSTWTATGGSTFVNATSATDATITIAGDTTATAHFIAGQQALTIQIKVDGVTQPTTFTTLSVQAKAAAAASYTTLYSQQQYACSTGDIITVIASAVSGYKFTGWTGDVTAGTPNTTGTVTMAAASKTIIANYATLHTITVLKETIPSGDGGTLSITNNYERVISADSYEYAYGTGASITATATPGYVFVGWDTNNDGTIDINGITTYTFNVNASATIKAIFAKTYTITFATDPADGFGGSITPSRGMTITYYHGQAVPLGATPNNDWGYHFQGWTATGGSTIDLPSDSAATLTVLGDGTVTGHFSLVGAERDLTIIIKVDGVQVAVAHPLTVSAGASTVPGYEATVALHSTQSKKYYPINNAALDASVSSALGSQYAFFGWEDLTGAAASNPVRTVAMNGGSKTLTALYKSRVTLVMATDPVGVGVTTPSVGTHNDVLRNDSVTIEADLQGSDLDNYIFREWTVDVGALPLSPLTSKTSIVMDPPGNTKTVTAHFDPGYRLDVLVKHETSTTPDAAPRTYAEAAGSRSSVASGAGNRAGIYNSEINTFVRSVETIKQGNTVIVRAIATSGYTFVGWELNNTIISTSADYTHTMTEHTTLKAVFDKVRVTLHVYTQPNTASFVGECTNGDLTSAAGVEPKTYLFFHGATASLHAENNDPDHYYFAGWRRGIGMGTLISGSLDTSYALTQSVTTVTALFLPNNGDYLLRIYTQPDEQSRPNPLDHPFITAVKTPGHNGTYTLDETGRPVYIVAVPSGIINIHADPSSGGWGFNHWEPISNCTVGSFGNRNLYGTTFTHTEAQGQTPLPEVSILAVYANIPGYWLNLRGVFDEPDAVKGDGYIPGTIFGSSLDSLVSWLYIGGTRRADRHIFGAGHIEKFQSDSTFQSSPVRIVGWDYQVGSTMVVTGHVGDTFTTNAGNAGVEETVTAHLVIDWKTVSVYPTEFVQPTGPDWPEPSSGFNGYGSFQTVSGNVYDAYFASRIIGPNAPFVWQGQRIRESSAPTLHVSNGDSANYRFLQWTTDFGTTAAQSPGWGSFWPQLLQQDRTATPKFIRLLPVTLAIVHAGGNMSQDKAVVEIPAGDPNNEGILVTASRAEPRDTQKYDYQRQITVTATPQASEYHVVKEFIVERDINNDGVFDASEKTIIPGDNTTAVKTINFSLDYPTKVTVVFEGQQSELTVNVANSVDGNPHGKIQLNGEPAAGALTQTGTFSYGTTQNVRAIPDANYTFKGWTVSPTNLAKATPSNSTSATVQVDFPKTVTAHFERNVTLVMATSPADVPGNILTPVAGTYVEIGGERLTDGSQVNIGTSIDSGWDFMHWEILDDDNPVTPRQINSTSSTLTLHGNTTATAKYAKLYSVMIDIPNAPFPEESKVTIAEAPVSGGPMTAIANGVSTRTGKYREETALTITATPGQHFEFSHWEINIDGVAQPNVTTPTYTIASLAGDTVVQAVFTPKNYTITVVPYSTNSRTPIASALTGATSASVTPPNHDFLLEGSTWVLPYGSTYSLYTAPASYYQFSRWSDLSTNLTLGNVAAECILSVMGNRTVRAEFVRSQYLLTTTVSPAGSGSISSDPPRGSNPSIHEINDELTLTASYNSNTDFDGWTGDIGTGVASSPTLPLKMSQDREVTANFVDIVRLKIVNPNPAYGTVVVDGERRTETDGDGNTIYIFKVGTQATIKGTPAGTNYQFDNWTFAPSTPAGVTDVTLATQTFTMTTAPDVLTVTANFSPKPYDLTVQYACTDSAPYDGAPVVTALTGNGFPGSPHNFLVTPTVSVRYNTAVTLDVAIAPYYKLDRWTDGSGAGDYGSNTSYSFNMPGGNTTRIARIVRGIWKLTAHISPSGGGTISYSEIGGIDPLGTPDTVVYPAQNPALTVTLTATNAAGKVFTGWEGDDAVSASGRLLTLTMSKDREVTANFANARTLTIPKDSEYGTVTVAGYSPYAEIITNPDGSKTYTFAEGDTATVTATPNTEHYEFSTWTFSPTTPAGVTAGALTISPISFAMNDDTTLTPTFTAKKYDITVKPYSSDPAPYVGAPIAATLTGAGAFPESVFNFLGGSDTVAIAYNTEVTLSQSPAAYYSFTKWTDDATHTQLYTSPFTVGVSDDSLTNRTIIAQYARSLYRLRAHVDPAGYGTISASPLGAADPLAQAETTVYAPGTSVTLTANAVPGKVFKGWSGDSITPSGVNLSFMMDRDRDVTATFANAYKVTIPASVNGTVSVIGYSKYAAVETDTITGAKTYTFAAGTEAMLTATPESVYYYLSNWAFSPDISATVTPPPNPGPGVEVPKTITFTVNQDVTVTATFLPNLYKLTVTPVPAAGALTLTSEIGGIFDHDFLVNPELEHPYPTLVTLLTTPKDVPGAHYRFDSWKQGVTPLGTGTSVSFMFDHHANITANYVRQIVVTINEPEDVTPSNTLPELTPGTVDPGAGTYRYDVTSTPTTRVITATAATGFKFAGWSGNVPASAVKSEDTTDTSSVAKLTLTIDDTLADAGDIVITPQFERRVYTVTIERWDKGLGVQGVGGAISAEGTSQYIYGTVISPYVSSSYSGYRFVGWGCGATTTASRTVQQDATGTFNDELTHTVTGDCTISAIFTTVHKLTIATSPTDGSQGTASITLPTGIYLGGTPPVYQYDHGTTVYIKATAKSGMHFVNWAGAVNESDNPNTYITLTSDQTVVARFTVTIYRELVISANPPSGGSVTMNDNAANSTGYKTGLLTSFTGTFTDGQTVHLTASPAPGYSFTGWTGPVVVNNPSSLSTTVVMNEDKSVQGNFTLRPYNLTVMASPSSGGIVSSGGSYYYDPDTEMPAVATITATANTDTGYTFEHWEVTGGAVDNANSATAKITMTNDTVAVAIFKSGDGSYPPKVVVMERPAGGGADVVNPSGGTYTVDPPDDQGRYRVTGRPNPGFEFVAWGGPDIGDSQVDSTDYDTDTHSELIYGDGRPRELHFIVSRKYVIIQWEALPSDRGTVSLDLANGTSLEDGLQGAQYPYSETESVTVKAIAAGSSVFDHWAGAVSGTGATTMVPLNGDKTIMAYFKPVVPGWDVTLDFDSDSDFHPSEKDRITLGSITKEKSDGITLIEGRFPHESTVEFYCTLAPLASGESEDYHFAGWSGITSRSYKPLGGNRYLLYVDGYLDPRAKIKKVKPILKTRIDMLNPADEDPERKPEDEWVSRGGSISPPAENLVIGQLCTIRVLYKPNYHISKWELSADKSTLGSTIRKGTDELSGLAYEERDVILRDLETSIQVYLDKGGRGANEAVIRRDKVHGSQNLHDDITTRRSSGHIIDDRNK